MKKFNSFRFDIVNHTGLIILSRPGVLNALNEEFFTELNDLLDHPGLNLRSLIITGEGKAFAAGADIAGMQKFDAAMARKFSEQGQKSLMRLEQLPVPVIAAVNGYALGGGCELALACDIRLASEKARFGMPEVSLGLIPGFGGTHRLMRSVSFGNAMQMLLGAEAIDARKALEIGLVQQIFKPEELIDGALELSRKMASTGPQATARLKKLLYASYSLESHKALEKENIEFGKVFGPEGKEGIKAFLEKRKPEW